MIDVCFILYVQKLAQRLERKLLSIERLLVDIKTKEINMAATLVELQAAITAVGEAAAADAAQDQLVIAAIEALIAKLNATPQAADFSAEVQALAGVVSSLQGSNANIQAELDKAGQA